MKSWQALKDYFVFYLFLEAGARRFTFKKLFLKMSQNSQENTRARTSVLIKLLAETSNFIKGNSGTGIFMWI